MSFKISKNTTMCESDLDNEPFRRAFYVEDDTADEDFTLPPTSGMEYLRRVRSEAKNCPSTVIANLDTEQFSNAQTVIINDIVDVKPAPPGCRPSTEWQQLQIKNFSDLKLELCAKKALLMQKHRRQFNIPKTSDKKGWYTFCLGKKVSSRLYESPGSSDSSEDDVDNSSAGFPPLLSVVLSLSRVPIETVLGYHIDWLKYLGFSHQQGRWIFALLSCLEKPLTPDACALLRNLVRVCADLRSNMTREDKFLSPLNLIICLVANYFDQKDMVDIDTEND